MSISLNTLVGLVRVWGERKGITGPNGKATILTQLAKSQEELTETRDAAINLLRDLREFGKAPASLRQVKDGIGDCAVTLILAADLAGLTFEECLQAAYDEIKGRTGRMVDGQFVKDTPPAFPENTERKEGIV